MAHVLAREAELDRLDRSLAQALAGRGQVCFVSGEAGSGKSTLLEEFASRALAAHETLIAVTGTCDAHTGSGDPFLPFREIMEQLTGDLEERGDHGPATKESARRLRHIVVTAGETLVELAPDLIGVVVPGASLLAKAGKYMSGKSKWADKLRTQIDEQNAAPGRLTNLDKGQVYEQYVNVLQRLSAEAPLLILVDDLQWADTASLGLMFRLARRIEGMPVMLVGTYRPNDIAMGRDGERHPLEGMLSEVKRYHGDVVIDLDEARKEGGRAFVDALLDQEPNALDAAFRHKLVEHTGGHPLFTIELLRDLQERGDIHKDDEGAWVAGERLEWEDLPSRVEGVIEERVARLDADTVQSLRVASVEGPQFTAEIVAKVQPTDVRELIRLLSENLQRQHRLVAAAGLRRVAGQRVSSYRFSHQLMQSYLYRQLDEAEASYLHEDVGLALEALFGAEADQIAVQLARHFDLAGLPEKAVPYLRLAGEQAVARYANEQAFEHFRRALELMPADDVDGRYVVTLAIVELHDKRGDARQRNVDTAELRALAERSGDPLKVARALYHRAEYEIETGDHDEAVRSATLAAETAAPLDDDEGLEGRARTALGRALMATADYPAAKDAFQKGLVLSRLAGSPKGEGLALSNLGIMADVTGHAALARSYFEQALAVHEAAGNRNAIPSALMNLAMSHWRTGDLGTARDLLERALRLAHEQGNRGTEATASSNLAIVYKDMGDLVRARRTIEHALALNREHNGPYHVARTLGVLASLLIGDHEYTAARAATREALDIDIAVGDRQDQVFRLTALGELAMVFGQHDEAEELLTQSLDLSREIEERNNESSALRLLADLRLDAGRLDEASALAEEALAVASAVGKPRESGACLLKLADVRLAQGRLDEAHDAYAGVLAEHGESFGVDATAGLVAVALQRGDAGAALERAAPLVEPALGGELATAIEPLRAYEAVYSALRAVHDARAHAVLEAARALIAVAKEKMSGDQQALSSFESRADVRRLLGA